MVKMVQDGPKWSKIVKNGKNGPKWSKMVKIGLKWSKMVKMVKNGGPDLKRARRTGLSTRRGQG